MSWSLPVPNSAAEENFEKLANLHVQQKKKELNRKAKMAMYD
jgi:hypothetical protein